MKANKRIFMPFRHVVVPVLPGVPVESALGLARSMGGEITLLGLIPAASAEVLSAEAAAARALRKELRELAESLPHAARPQVRVALDPCQALRAFLAEDPPDLLILEYPQHFDALGCQAGGLISWQACDVAVVRGPWPQHIGRALVPVRGGPYAELALRLGLAVPHDEVLALHLTSPAAPEKLEGPFRGLASVLPRLRGVNYRHEVAGQPLETILGESAEASLLVMGTSARSPQDEPGIGPGVERVMKQAACPVVAVKTSDPLPLQWTGTEGELSGQQAISLLVDRWFAENTYHADEFDDLERLLALKREQGVSISLALPALNEEETVGNVIRTMQQTLMQQVPLLDEIVLIDSNSSDQTRRIATDLGVPVFIHQQLLPAYGPRRGKGEALWKSLLVTHGDLVIWMDTDIVNVHPRFVYGVIGPLLLNPQVQFVKGFYQRPLKSGEALQAGAGGRVTELTARPLLNLFYPELSGVIQPLSGEYGGRRKALEQLSFFSGYGVEIGLLIDVFEKFGLAAVAQVDLLERIHHNQSLEALSKMSFAIQQAVFRRLETRYGRPILEDVNKSMKLIRYEEGSYRLQVEEVAERDRPPMIDLPEYHAARG